MKFIGKRSYKQSSRKGFYPRLEKRLFNHISKMRSKGACIGQKYIKMKARKIAVCLNLQRFSGNYFYTNLSKF